MIRALHALIFSGFAIYMKPASNSIVEGAGSTLVRSTLHLGIRYLGIPIHYRRRTNDKWKIVEERLQLRLSSWRGKLLSIGGRLILINPILINMVLYMLSFFVLPKGVLKILDYL
jgi:hypothetical protein